MSHLDPALIRDLFDYRASDGALLWRAGMSKRPAGSVAGCVRAGLRHTINLPKPVGGYWHVPRHRCVWAYHYGTWPDALLKSIDGDLANDRIENLAIETPAQRSVRGAGRFSGARKVCARWVASISVQGEFNYLGTFDTEAEAVAAYRAAHVAAHGDASPYAQSITYNAFGIRNDVGVF